MPSLPPTERGQSLGSHLQIAVETFERNKVGCSAFNIYDRKGITYVGGYIEYG